MGENISSSILLTSPADALHAGQQVQGGKGEPQSLSRQNEGSFHQPTFRIPQKSRNGQKNIFTNPRFPIPPSKRRTDDWLPPQVGSIPHGVPIDGEATNGGQTRRSNAQDLLHHLSLLHYLGQNLLDRQQQNATISTLWCRRHHRHRHRRPVGSRITADGAVCLDNNNNNQWHPDKVTSLPGWNQPLPSDWYSGYLEYELEGQHVHTHYVLVTAEENENLEETPLIYWSNGGPGASSLYGLLTELGPLWLSEESLKTDSYRTTGIPSPQYNPYTWTRLGTILIIDQPAPVGFSYCNNDTKSHSCGGIAWTDELASLNAYTALQTFFETKDFPCLQSRELYLTGESYGGIYIPTLARRIVRGNDDNNNATTMNLKGFAVGDGCLGTHTTMCGGLGSSNEGFADYWHIWFMAGHHQIPLNDFRQVMKACSHAEQPELLVGSTAEMRQKDDLCKAALKKTKAELGGFFEYALYDECTYSNGLRQKQQYRWKSLLGLDESYGFGGALNDYPCGGGQVMEEYLKLPQVKEAFHVRSDFFEVDNAEGDFDYTPTEPNLMPFYQEMNGKIKILVYNGDTDPAITSFATQNWTSHLGFDETQHWRPWTIDNCKAMGGYVTRYEGNFDFLTIRGAGHMVPTYKPAASFAFLKAWLQDEEYPSFDANCTDPVIEDGLEKQPLESSSLRSKLEVSK